MSEGGTRVKAQVPRTGKATTTGGGQGQREGGRFEVIARADAEEGEDLGLDGAIEAVAHLDTLPRLRLLERGEENTVAAVQNLLLEDDGVCLLANAK